MTLCRRGKSRAYSSQVTGLFTILIIIMTMARSDCLLQLQVAAKFCIGIITVIMTTFAL